MRIKELRLEKGMSQQELAEIIHVTQQSVFKYEHDMSIPELDVLIACANYFDVSIDYLVNETDNPLKYDNYTLDNITSQERRLLDYYRRLNPQAQSSLLSFIEAFLIHPNESSETKS